MSPDYTKESNNRRLVCDCANKEVIKDMKKDISDLQTDLKLVESFKGRAEIVGYILLFIFGASFLYTYNHIQSSTMMQAAIHSEAIQEHDKIKRMLNANEDDIADNEANLRVSNDRYSRLITDIGKVDTRLSQLVEMLTKHDKAAYSLPKYFQSPAYPTSEDEEH